MPDVTGLARWSRGAEKLFNVKGGPSIVDLDHQVRVDLNEPIGLDTRYLFGWESFAAGSAQVAVAANKSACMLRNPLGSGVIIVVEKIHVSSTVGEQYNLVVAGSNPTDLATIQPNHARADPRTRNFGSAIASMDAPAVDPATGFLIIGSALEDAYDWIITPSQEIVLLPQIALRVVGQTANQALVWMIWWRERPLESSELT